MSVEEKGSGVRAQAIAMFLESKGLELEIDQDGDVVFVYRDSTYFVSVDEDDDTYLCLCFTAHYPSDFPEEVLLIHEACSKINRTVKCAKLAWEKDRLLIATECFLAAPKDYEAIFFRCIEAITGALSLFLQEAKRANSESVDPKKSN